MAPVWVAIVSALVGAVLGLFFEHVVPDVWRRSRRRLAHRRDERERDRRQSELDDQFSHLYGSRYMIDIEGEGLQEVELVQIISEFLYPKLQRTDGMPFKNGDTFLYDLPLSQLEPEAWESYNDKPIRLGFGKIVVLERLDQSARCVNPPRKTPDAGQGSR